MCICINCMYVNNCRMYQKVMQQHLSGINKQNVQFNPAQPIVYVNANYTTKSIKVDWDIVECLSFIDSPGNWIYSIQDL